MFIFQNRGGGGSTSPPLAFRISHIYRSSTDDVTHFSRFNFIFTCVLCMWQSTCSSGRYPRSKVSRNWYAFINRMQKGPFFVIASKNRRICPLEHAFWLWNTTTAFVCLILDWTLSFWKMIIATDASARLIVVTNELSEMTLTQFSKSHRWSLTINIRRRTNLKSF